MTKLVPQTLCLKLGFQFSFNFIFVFLSIFRLFFHQFSNVLLGECPIKQITRMVRWVPDTCQSPSKMIPCRCQTLHCYDYCFFCNYHKESSNKTSNMPQCCENQNIRDISGQLTCVYCGQVVGEDFKTEYINFHANLFKIYKKTVYNRKYHLSHTLDQIILKNKVEISCSTNFKIHKIFVEINKILPQINGKRPIVHAIRTFSSVTLQRSRP